MSAEFVYVCVCVCVCVWVSEWERERERERESTYNFFSSHLEHIDLAQAEGTDAPWKTRHTHLWWTSATSCGCIGMRECLSCFLEILITAKTFSMTNLRSTSIFAENATNSFKMRSTSVPSWACISCSKVLHLRREGLTCSLWICMQKERNSSKTSASLLVKKASTWRVPTAIKFGKVEAAILCHMRASEFLEGFVQREKSGKDASVSISFQSVCRRDLNSMILVLQGQKSVKRSRQHSKAWHT